MECLKLTCNNRLLSDSENIVSFLPGLYIGRTIESFPQVVLVSNICIKRVERRRNASFLNQEVLALQFLARDQREIYSLSVEALEFALALLAAHKLLLVLDEVLGSCHSRARRKDG